MIHMSSLHREKGPYTKKVEYRRLGKPPPGRWDPPVTETGAGAPPLDLELEWHG
jgi:hypothetical protein